MKQAPESVEDSSGSPRFGTYLGAPGSCSLGKVSGRKSFFRRKRWQYQIITTPELIVLYAIVDLNYASSAFLTAFDLKRGEVFDRSFLGLPMFTKVRVGDFSSDGADASFKGCGVELGLQGFEDGYSFKVREKDLFLNAQAWIDHHRAISVIAPVPGGLVNVTQKNVASKVRGALTVNGRTFDLSRGLAALDYTQGYLARRTTWRWAMGLGRLDDGTPFGFNLVEGINESEVTSENALWIGERTYPLGRAAFDWDRKDLMNPWTVRTLDDAVRIRFTPRFIHREEKNLLLVKSTFAQPVGLFEGDIEIDGRSFSFKDIGGVTEFQDSIW